MTSKYLFLFIANCLLQCACIIADDGTDQTKYADGWSPKDAAKNMLVPDGFSVDLIAAEPTLTQPIAMCFDARGRIWVVEGHTYPEKASEGQGRDRILILSDEDANGSFETSKVFVEGINLASGIEVGFGGVWVGAAPQLLFYPDADRDDIPDGEPKVLLDGWGYQDTHETLNSFTWGPDGWLYGCHGVFTHSNVGKPGTREDQRTPINAGVWRYHPTHDVFEVYAHGTSNPWGLDFNEQGDWFVTACVIEHLFHLQQGGRYKRQAGNHFDPNTYADIQTIADHAHYVGDLRDHAFWGDNFTNRPAAALDTSALGGGHAHCGLAIYDGDVFPPSYRGQMFFHNLHGHRVVVDRIENKGSGYVGRHQPDFALSRDHQQIGVGIMVGPDGALYTSDWHDPQTCHNRSPEIWNRTDGRLFRIRYGQVAPQSFNLWNESDIELVSRLTGGNGFIARQSARIIQERAVVGSLDVASVVKRLRTTVASESSQRNRLRAVWLLGSLDDWMENDWMELIGDSDEYVRAWVIQFQGQFGEKLDQEMVDTLSQLARRDASPVVRRYLASLANRIPLDQRLPILAGLMSHSEDRDDANIPLLVWYALEPLTASESGAVYALAKQCDWPKMRRFVVRRAATTKHGRDLLVERLTLNADPVEQSLILEELLASAKSRGGVDMPDRWPEAFRKLRDANNIAIASLSRSLAVQFGDKSVAVYFRNALSDRSAAMESRINALDALSTIADEQLPENLLGLLDDPKVATACIAALGKFSDADIPGRMLAVYEQLDAPARSAVMTTLASRAKWAGELVGAIESGRIAADTVPAFVVRQVASLDDPVLTGRLEKVWGKVNPTSEEKLAQYQKYRGMLAGAKFDQADRGKGRALYEANCGKCHKLFGVGGEIGPDITGANRTSIDYWLENILEPNALIGRDYLTTKFLMDDGRLIVGLVKESNDDAVTVQTATEKVVLSRDEIEQQVQSETSLMPEGQLEPMSEDQVRQLFNYLRSPSQVENH